MKSAVIPAFLLSGCAMSVQPLAPAAAAACNADAAASLVGQTPSAELGAQALTLTGGRTIRWLLPNQAVTMDYREDRLNIAIDPAYRIARITCG